MNLRPGLDKIFSKFCEPHIFLEGEEKSNLNRVRDIIGVIGKEGTPLMYMPAEGFIPQEIEAEVSDRFHAWWDYTRLRRQFYQMLYDNNIGLAHVNIYEASLCEYWELQFSDKHHALQGEANINGWWQH